MLLFKQLEAQGWGTVRQAALAKAIQEKHVPEASPEGDPYRRLAGKVEDLGDDDFKDQAVSWIQFVECASTVAV